MRVKKIYFLGSSHAKRLGAAANKFRVITDKYQIDNRGISGANFTQLKNRPDPRELKKDDIVIFQCFGNNLMRRPKYRRGERFPMENFLTHRNQIIRHKKIHLQEFEPIDLSIVRRDYLLAKRYFEKLPCRVILIDNPIRHTACCPTHSVEHRRRGLFDYQKQRNKELRSYFQEVKNVTALNHLSLLGLTNEKYTKSFYEKLLPDSVHLSSELYDSIIENLLSRDYIPTN